MPDIAIYMGRARHFPRDTSVLPQIPKLRVAIDEGYQIFSTKPESMGLIFEDKPIGRIFEGDYSTLYNEMAARLGYCGITSLQEVIVINGELIDETGTMIVPKVSPEKERALKEGIEAILRSGVKVT